MEEGTTRVTAFLEFLKSADVRYYQERELGLDIYLSGVWGILPVLCAVVAATVFLLAIFQLVPRRSRSISLLALTGVLALVVGLVGAYWNFEDFVSGDGETLPRIFIDGRGRYPEVWSHQAALLGLPLFLGVSVLVESIVFAAFLALFGRADRPGAKTD